MIDPNNVFIRLTDAKAALGMPTDDVLANVEQFTLTDGYESNEAGISELRDKDGQILCHDGSRIKY
jgi:hypothetical protein